jgi:CheY-like chemotaxis protein
VQPVPAVNGTGKHQVCIDVADSGMGMSEETRLRCVEPFYTTKGERGTGLGLAMVYGTVQRHGADIDIRSAPGRGTTVTLRFAAAAVAQAGRPVEDDSAKAEQRRLRILVVDDDPFLLRAVTVALESEGHVVVPAKGGQEGIDAFAATQGGVGTFDVAITDLGMPYVDGRKVAAAIKGMDPAMPVVMLTGWGQRLMTEGDIPEYVDQLLAKPPKLRDLRATLAQLCGTPAP